MKTGGISARRDSDSIEFGVKRSFQPNWAKTKKNGEPGIGVEPHCLHVGAVTLVWLRRFPAQVKRLGLSPQLIAFLAACHDVGKHSPGFLSKSPIWLQNEGLSEQAVREGWAELQKCGHERVSQAALYDWFLGKGMSPANASLFSAMVGLHHGVLHWQELGAKIPCKGAIGQTWQSERSAIIDALYKAFDCPELPPEWEQNDERLFAIAGLISVCDWLGSDEAVFAVDVALPLDQAQEVAEVALDRYGFRPMEVKPGLDFAALFGMQARPWQSEILGQNKGRGPQLIEAPMGEGKTELALTLTYQVLRDGEASGFYFALPTRASSQALLPRIEAFVAKITDTPVKLIHALSWLDEKQPQTAGEIASPCRDWFASSRRALLAPIGIGTIDQVLHAVLAIRHFQVRRLALLGKVIIIDEIHSYDAYTGSLVERLLRLLEGLGCRIIVLSATLSSKRRQELLPDLRLPAAASFPPRPTVFLRRKAMATLISEAEAAAATGACVLWIASTVRSAQEIYEQLQGRGLKALLHASFTRQDRAAKEEFWLQALGKNGPRPQEGCILVASQIAEQSLDIDADLLISDLCPGDFLLQRIGRLWRHSDRQRPLPQAECWLLDETRSLDELRQDEATKIKACFGARAKVYPPYLLLRTLLALESRQILRLPQDIGAVVNEIYDDAPPISEPAAWRQLRQEWAAEEQDSSDLARGAASIWANRDWRGDPPPGTRLDDNPTREVAIVPADKLPELLASLPTHPGDIARIASPYILRLPQWAQKNWGPEPRWAAIGEGGRLELPEPRSDFYYDSELGLQHINKEGLT